MRKILTWHTYPRKFPDEDGHYSLTPGTHTIKVTDTSGNETCVKITILERDTNAPTGNIQVRTSGFKKLINTITFGLFCKKTETVTITAEDVTGNQADGDLMIRDVNTGVKSIGYHIADLSGRDGYTDEELKNLADSAWTPIENGGSFGISPKGIVDIYVRIEDNAGNVAYINTDGIVLYEEAVQVTDKITYMKGTMTDTTAVVDFNGNTVKAITYVDSGEAVSGS